MLWKFICRSSVQLAAQLTARKTCQSISSRQHRKRDAFRSEDKLDNSPYPS